MSTEQKQVNKKIRKTREQLKQEFKNVRDKIIKVFVDELAQAIRDENSEWAGKTANLDADSRYIIRRGVIDDCRELEINIGYVYNCLPSWLEDDIKTQAAKKRYETKNQAKLQNISLEVTKISEIQVTPPPTQTDEFDSLDAELYEAGLGEFGDTGKSVRELLEDIYLASSRLFSALTLKNMPYGATEDFILDYLKPTREFRKSLMLELSKDERTNVFNYMHYITQLAEDTINMIDEAEKK